MFCNNCKYNFPDGYLSCPNCGTPLMSNYNAGNMKKPNLVLWIILGVLEALFLSRIFGLIVVLEIISADKNYKAGDYEGCKKKKKSTVVCFILGIIFGIAANVILMYLN